MIPLICLFNLSSVIVTLDISILLTMLEAQSAYV